MNLYFMIATMVANIAAIVFIYQFIKRLQKKEIVIFLAICYAIIYGLVSLIYWISGFGIDKIINDATKDFLIYLFVPVNVIILIPFVANKYAKFKEKKINKRDFAEMIVKIAIAGLIILTIECIYFRNVKKNIETLGNSIEQTKNNENTNQIDDNNNSIFENYEIDEEENIVDNTNTEI